MAKVKLTKTALKAERDALKQFRRFLPTLQLKKQQLQMELRACQERISRNEEQETLLKNDLASWIKLFGNGTETALLEKALRIRSVSEGKQNIAGVEVPVFRSMEFEPAEIDLFCTDPWMDDAAEALRKILSLREERTIIRRQHELLRQELRTTTQRVNLFEKVKIPECLENIRVIQIYIGDAQTAAVARSKIAKRKLQEVVA